jgi:hypothetical protein
MKSRSSSSRQQRGRRFVFQKRDQLQGSAKYSVDRFTPKEILTKIFLGDCLRFYYLLNVPTINLEGRFGKIHVPPSWQKPCKAGQWGDAVLAVRSESAFSDPNPYPFNDIPVSLAPDRNGGISVLSTCRGSGAYGRVRICVCGIGFMLRIVKEPSGDQ